MIGEQPLACAPCTVNAAAFDEPDGGQFLVGLVDLRQQRAAGHRHHGVPGRAPAQLLRDLEAHRLGAFGVVGPQVHVDEAPAVFARDLRAQAVDLIVSAVDADDARAVHQRVEHLAAFQVGGDQHVARQPGRGGVGRDGVGQVARGRAGDDLETEFPRPAQATETTRSLNERVG